MTPPENPPPTAVRVDGSLAGVDWERLKADLADDAWDNGRSALALRLAFERCGPVALARDGDRVVGTARLLSDGVSNAYLVDVWTLTPYRRQGIATRMVEFLLEQVPGQHVALQTDDAHDLYASLGFESQQGYWAKVVGTWLDNDANR